MLQSILRSRTLLVIDHISRSQCAIRGQFKNYLFRTRLFSYFSPAFLWQFPLEGFQSMESRHRFVAERVCLALFSAPIVNFILRFFWGAKPGRSDGAIPDFVSTIEMPAQVRFRPSTSLKLPSFTFSLFFRNRCLLIWYFKFENFEKSQFKSFSVRTSNNLEHSASWPVKVSRPAFSNASKCETEKWESAAQTATPTKIL